MAKGTKPDNKDDAGGSGASKKSRTKLIIIVAALIALIAAGTVAAYFLLQPHPPAGHEDGDKADVEAESKTPAEPPKFIELGTFTTNLAVDEGDDKRYVNVAVTYKITRAELEPKIKEFKPELLHRVNLLLQSKYPSELATPEGQIKLAEEIKIQSQHVLGLRKTAPAIGMAQAISAVPDTGKVIGGLDEVLFTTFLIQ